MKKTGLSSSCRFLFLLIFSIFFIGQNIYSQDKIDLDQLSASEEFKWGVKAYHRGIFAEAARAFERALAYKPENAEYQQWLGLSWYRSGFTDEALNIWSTLSSAGKADSILLNRLEILEQKTGIEGSFAPSGRYLNALNLSGDLPDYSLFKRPSSIYPDKNGGFFLSSYGTNEILRFNSNAAVTGRLNGGLEGFNHPFDVVIGDNGLVYVSEFNGDRITRCTVAGRELIRFGETGRGEGQLLGPQFMAFDDKGYLYVTDSGNRRVVKFDSDGNYILDFGTKTYNFKGLGYPTGIACISGFVYVADARNGSVTVFDQSGNYISVLAQGKFNRPEGLSVKSPENLFVADSTRIMNLNTETGMVTMVSELEGEGDKVMKAVVDSNNNLLTADFDRNAVTVLTEMANLYSGLFVQIDRVDSSRFPEITVDIRVQDRLGVPFVGLLPNNFVLTDNNYQASDVNLLFSGNTVSSSNIAVLLDCRESMSAYVDESSKAVSSLYDAVDGHASLRLISSGSNPATENNPGEGIRNMLDSVAKSEIYASDARFDLGLRHAVSELIPGRGRRSIVYITDGGTSDYTFEQFHPIELADYMLNNGISFYCITLNNKEEPDAGYQYLCEKTGGEIIYLYRPEGLKGLVEMINGKPDGSYTLGFRSMFINVSPDDYIPIEVEAFLFNRSGREKSGYYKPEI